MIIFLLMAQALAAPAQRSDICEIQAEFVSLETRKQKFDEAHENWRKQMGLSKTVTYTDVSLDLKKIKAIQGKQGDCNLKSLQKKTFQLRSGEELELKKGDCFTAKTQFSGDEFLIGQWLWDVKEQCK